MSQQREFDGIFRAHYEELFHFALQLMGRREEADDIVMSAFEDLWRMFDHVDHSALRAMLYRMVRNKCVDSLRRRGYHQQYVSTVMRLTQGYTDKDTLAEEDERAEKIRVVLARLKPPTSEIFKACLYEHKQYKEIARELGISLSMVKKHMVKALRIIKEG
jgi:RNA polymerase sigma-70 factor (family 1)